MSLHATHGSRGRSRRSRRWGKPQWYTEICRLQQELQDARQLIAAQWQLLTLGEEPPDHLVHAWRAWLHRDHPVTVDMGGAQVTVVAAADAFPADPIRERCDWQQVRAVVDSARRPYHTHRRVS